jgi:hypothetical protein
VSSVADFTSTTTLTHLPEETRAAAVARIEKKHAAALLLEALGLVDPEPQVVPLCPTCGNRLPDHGVCRRPGRCRVNAAKADDHG